MGKILKAEFTYNLTAILIGYSIVFLALLVGLIGGMDNIHNLIPVAFITFFISVGIMGSESDKEKRDRLLTSLPIPIKQYSLARLLFVIFYQLGMFLLLLLFYLFKVTSENAPIFWDIVTMNSYTLIFISFFILYSDLKFYRSKYYCYIYLSILFLIIALLIIGMVYRVIPPVLVFGENLPKTIFDAIIFNVIFVIVYYVCFKVYNGRNSYLG
jgi:hypothetical protein